MIIALDCPAYIHASYYCNPNMTLTYFRRRLEMIDREWSHLLDHKLVAFDSHVSERRKIFPEYKAGRGEKEQGLKDCLRDAVNVALECDWPVATIEGWEADDILASVARQGSDAGHKVILVTPDKDLAQCLMPEKVTQLISLRSDYGEMKKEWRRACDVPAKFGVEAHQMIAYQCLVGDDGDNIKGVEGIGKKNAIKLLKERAGMDELFANPWVSGLGEKLRNRLIAFQHDRYNLVRQLVTLRTDLDLSGIIDFTEITI